MGCIFCEFPVDKFIDQTDLSFVVRDAFPVTKFHTLIIPKRHEEDYFELSHEEKQDIQALLVKHKSLIETLDSEVTGFNVGINVGKSSGQTVFHVHTHLIPRRDGDVEDPRGGVRGVIPNKQSY